MELVLLFVLGRGEFRVYKVVPAVCADVKQNHASFCSFRLVLVVYRFVVLAVWTFHWGVGQCGVRVQILRHTGLLFGDG